MRKSEMRREIDGLQRVVDFAYQEVRRQHWMWDRAREIMGEAEYQRVFKRIGMESFVYKEEWI